MIISVDDMLTELYDELKKAGYQVYKFSENKNSDVVIYSGDSTHLASLNAPLFTAYGGGVFLINGDGKTVSEIEGMIRHRAYSPIF